MIKKERLQQLIEENGSVYEPNVEDGIVQEIILFEEFNLIRNEALYFGVEKWAFLKDLYETKEEAEHFAKYGNITKTVKFPTPPTYEEFLKIKEFYSGQGLTRIVLINEKELEVVENGLDGYHSYRVSNTKENYYKCLGKMIELWKEIKE